MSAQQDARFVEGFAYRDTAPGRTPTLHVFAVWVCPTTGYSLKLEPFRPAPGIVQLLLVETKPSGFALPVETPIVTDFSAVARDEVKEVLILPSGRALPVLDVSLQPGGAAQAAELPEGALFPAANHFELKADGHTVVYSATSITGSPVLAYNDRSFSDDAVHTQDTPLGQLVTVLLETAPDGPATFFNVMVPPVRLDWDEPEASVKTFGVKSVYRSYLPPAFALGQLLTYEQIGLTGKASFIVT